MKTPSFHTGLVVFAVAFFSVVLLAAVTSAQRPDESQQLPEAVLRSIRSAYPDARVDEVETERRLVRFFEITVVQNGEEHDLTVSQDGTILKAVQEISPDDLPMVVHTAVERGSDGGFIQEAQEVVVFAQLGVVPLPVPRTEYELEYRSNGKTQELVVSQTGSVIATPRRLSLTDDD